MKSTRSDPLLCPTVRETCSSSRNSFNFQEILTSIIKKCHGNLYVYRPNSTEAKAMTMTPLPSPHRFTTQWDVNTLKTPITPLTLAAPCLKIMHVMPPRKTSQASSYLLRQCEAAKFPNFNIHFSPYLAGQN